MMMKEAFYFGKLSDRGHHLYDENKNKVNIIDKINLPWSIYHLDTGLLELSKIPEVLDGRVYWTKKGSPLWHAFFWWDRSGDLRSQSNSGFYVRGFYEYNQLSAFSYAMSKFPEITKRQFHTLKLQQIEVSLTESMEE